MKAKGAAAYGALAAVGLVAAYATWQRGPDLKDRGDVVVLDLQKKQVLKVRYEDGKRILELARGTGAEEGVWVTEVQKPPPPPAADPHAGLFGPDAGTATPLSAAHAAGAADGGTTLAAASPMSAPAPKPPEPKPPEPKLLRGNEQAEKTFESFAPLMATRALGTLDDKKLEELGLKTTQRTVTVHTPSGEQVYTVTYPPSGIGSAYFQSRKDGSVYLVKGQLLGDLEFAATRLVDRRLHAFKPEEFDAVQISSEGKVRRFTHAGGKLSAEGSTQADDFARNWHDRVWRFVPTELLGKGQLPEGGEPRPVFRVEYLSKGQPLGFTEVAKLDELLYVRTEHTAGWVRTHAGAGDLLGEAKKVVEGS